MYDTETGNWRMVVIAAGLIAATLALSIGLVGVTFMVFFAKVHQYFDLLEPLGFWDSFFFGWITLFFVALVRAITKVSFSVNT